MATSTFEFTTFPIADPGAVVTCPHVRFTILTSRLFRLEYDPKETFEDRPSQAFWFRQQPVPSFKQHVTPASIVIETDDLKLRYLPTGHGFSARTLSVEVKALGTIWHYGDSQWKGNLMGTARTLDGADGPIPLETGLVSRDGWAVVDDSHSLVFNSLGWLEHRSNREAIDLYFFGYGHDYTTCLRDFTRVAGPVPLIPRWILGNWWSRYWPYSQDELKALMEDFRRHQIPLAVCIVDMDWHITATGNSSSGWTGYTWNRNLFPDPTAFLSWLHNQGLHTALNLHPAEGIHPHEEQYPLMAATMGIDPASQQPVTFDIADSHFMRAYFDILHHPMEEQGVDFWWLDWQQGSGSKMANLDPLWLLNHLHFNDAGRNKDRRPFIFSRWGGLGNHRYPIGFSGDTFSTWNSLAYQPFFTATAANVAYGWWSHDIGGHMHGSEDRELYTRWVQFGVFSPILRLHSTFNEYQERRPWGYDSEVLEITRTALRLRHSLIPYLYTMAWHNATQSLPLVTPMYYSWPEEPEAYRCSDQYCFGSELVVAPFLTPANQETHLSRGSLWLPTGDWFNFFSGEYLEGGKWYPLFGGLADVPVFGRAGGIVPLGPNVDWGGTQNPDELTLVIFPGASGQFELYEDEGMSQAYLEGHDCISRFTQDWDEDRLQFTVAPADGDRSLIPAERTYNLTWRGLSRPEKVELAIDNNLIDLSAVYSQPDEIFAQVNTQTQNESLLAANYDADSETFVLSGIHLKSSSRLVVNLAVVKGQSLLSKRNRKKENIRKILRHFSCDSEYKRQIDTRLDEFLTDPSLLGSYGRLLTEAQMGLLLQVLSQ